MNRHFVFLTLDFYPLPIAKHLQDEGQEVIVGMVQNRKELGLDEQRTPKEKPEEREQRLSNHDGLLKKRTAQQVLAMLRGVPKQEQDDYFFFFDFNEMYNIAGQVLKMGFRNGLFPTKWYFDMEKNRKKANEFVSKHYDHVTVAESKDFKLAKDGVKFVEESDEIWVLKSNGSVGKTIVPRTNDVNIAKMLITDALEEYTKEYESQGFILEKKILDCLEVTPVMVFYNGEPVYSLVEFENKEFGAGNLGVLKGGNQAVSIRTKLDCKINQIAFPPIVYELAKKQPGLAIYDAGLLWNGKEFGFTEWCSMRYGWDGFFGEAVMRDDGEPFITNYLEDIIAGVNPLKKKYGAYVRMFNYEGDYEFTNKAKDDIPIYWYKSIEKNLFLYNVKMKKDKVVSVGGADFIGVMTGAGDTLEAAVNRTYDALEKKIYFERLLYRPKFDFLSTDYPTSIVNRIESLKEFI